MVLGAPMDHNESHSRDHNQYYPNSAFDQSPPNELSQYSHTHQGHGDQWDPVHNQHYPVNDPYGPSSSTQHENDHIGMLHGSTSFDFNEHSNEGMQLGQNSNQGHSSSTWKIPEMSSSHHNPLPYAERQILATKELRRRSRFLNRFAWQRKYHEAELLKIYTRMANQWRALPMTSMIDTDYRLNQYLDVNTNLIDNLLGSNGDSYAADIALRGVRPSWNPEPQDSMTPQQYIQWIIDPSKAWNPPDWAPNSVDEQDVQRIIDRLRALWKMREDQVEQRLNSLSSSQMAPFIEGLLSKKRNNVMMTASHLETLYFRNSHQE